MESMAGLRQDAGERSALRENDGHRRRPAPISRHEGRRIEGPLHAHPSRARRLEERGGDLDNRNLPLPELVELYHSAHVLVSPSEGEGWNLVLCEAMATGMPAIASAHTAMRDYFDESVGFPVTAFEKHVFNKSEPDYYGLAPTVPAIVARLQEVFDNYAEALERGRRASERMAGFTWSAAAENSSTFAGGTSHDEVCHHRRCRPRAGSHPAPVPSIPATIRIVDKKEGKPWCSRWTRRSTTRRSWRT